MVWPPFSPGKSDWSPQGLRSCPLSAFVLVEEVSPDRYTVGRGPSQAPALLADWPGGTEKALITPAHGHWYAHLQAAL